MIKGISVIVCCFNSVARLQKTLGALAQQQLESALKWEVILVDNASTDGTSEAAIHIWDLLGTPTRLRILFEPQPGLRNARNKGVNESKYSIILFCDDDNWLNPHYVQTAFDTLECNPRIAACGGRGIPVFETEKPRWFNEYAEAFAVGSQKINYESNRLLSLYGAGLTIKKKALNNLYAAGFVPLLLDRNGSNLSSSGDTELTNALVLSGYELFYEADLTFFHFLPKERLTISYLTKLFTAFGTDGPLRNLYYSFLTERLTHKRLVNWWPHLGIAIVRLVKYVFAPPKKTGRFIYFKWSIAYIKSLIRLYPEYTILRKNILKIQNTASFEQHNPFTSSEAQIISISKFTSQRK